MAVTGVAALDDSDIAVALQSEVLMYVTPAMTTREFLRFATPGPSVAAQFSLYTDPGPADTLAGGDDLTSVSSDTLADSAKTATAAEIGFRVDITDLRKATAIQDVYSDVAKIVGLALGEQWEDTLAKLMDDFSNVSTAASTLTTVDLLSAVSALEQRDVPSPYAGYLDPKQTGELRNEIATTTASYQVGGDRDLVQPFGASGFFGTYMGLPIWQTSLVVTTSGLVGGAVFQSGEAIGVYEIWGPRIETQRDASERTMEFVGTAAFGMVEIDDNRGQTIKSAA